MKLEFPRNGTSRCPFVPGQKSFPVLLSLCPGTRAGAKILGQTPLSRDVPGQNEFKNFNKMTRFPVFGHHFCVLEHLFLLCLVLSRVPSRILAVPALPVHWQDFELVQLSLCPKKLHCPVSLETLVYLQNF